jgi:hypothetical protein
MSGCGIRKDIAERLKNKQTAASIDAITTAEVECSHTSGTSTRGVLTAIEDLILSVFGCCTLAN